MILLDNDQTLSAVRRALEQHVLPRLTDEFARIQVEAAMLALDEVVDRLRNGDPYERLNPRIEGRLDALRSELSAPGSADDDARLGADLGVVLEDAGRVEDPRRRWDVLVGRLDALVLGPGPGHEQLRKIIQEEAGWTASEDARWLCGPAIESLQ
jgi:hypothetical protein